MAENGSNRADSGGPNNTMLRRTRFLFLVCGIVAFVVLAAKLFEIQIIKHDLYESAAINQQVKEIEISAYRGTIYDTNGLILAMSASADNVYLSPYELKQYDLKNHTLEEIVGGLSEILSIDYDVLMARAQREGSWYEVVARKVSDEVSRQLRQYIADNNLIGVKLEPGSKRFYPYGCLASHIIGFVGQENTGLAGIEAEYESYLTGSVGRVVRSANGAGTSMLYTNYEEYYDARDGDSLVLTVDATIQNYLEKHLKQAVEDYEIQNGAAAICMDVNTGAIKGMVSLGDYDLNDSFSISEEAQRYIDETATTDEERNSLLADAQYLQWRNKALSDTYEPGSTFKIITLSMALDAGVVSESSTFYCGGKISVTGDSAGKSRSCWKTVGHGSQTLTQAVQHSCNVAFIQIGLLVGAQRFYDYAEGFGFLTRTGNADVNLTARTGIDLSGESGSIWWSENTFTDPENMTQLAAASFGQTFTITPLQLITAVSACVNGGNLMKPYVVESVTNDSGELVLSNEPSIVRRVISEETSAKVCSILEQVVGDPVEGTGKNAYVAGYRIGGKTGTSTKTTTEVSTGEREYIVSFLGFAPADDPQLAILVLLDDPGSATVYPSGGQMAAPVVGNMFADILPYIGVEREYTEAERTNMDKSMPDVSGMTLEQAKAAVEQAGLTCRVVGEGADVTAQLPTAHTVIASGSEVIIYAGAEPSTDLETMLDLQNLSYSTARQRLSYYGIYMRTNSSITDPDRQLISTQSIAAGLMVEHGTVVEVTLVTDDAAMIGRY